MSKKNKNKSLVSFLSSLAKSKYYLVFLVSLCLILLFANFQVFRYFFPQLENISESQEIIFPDKDKIAFQAIDKFHRLFPTFSNYVLQTQLFKPLEQYTISTACDIFDNQADCQANQGCSWQTNTFSCANVSLSDCGLGAYSTCTKNSNYTPTSCSDSDCNTNKPGCTWSYSTSPCYEADCIENRSGCSWSQNYGTCTQADCNHPPSCTVTTTTQDVNCRWETYYEDEVVTCSMANCPTDKGCTRTAASCSGSGYCSCSTGPRDAPQDACYLMGCTWKSCSGTTYSSCPSPCTWKNASCTGSYLNPVPLQRWVCDKQTVATCNGAGNTYPTTKSCTGQYQDGRECKIVKTTVCQGNYSTGGACTGVRVTPTPKPTLLPTPIPKKANGESCTIDTICLSGYCDPSDFVCAPIPTPIPSPKLTPTPDPIPSSCLVITDSNSCPYGTVLDNCHSSCSNSNFICCKQLVDLTNICQRGEKKCINNSYQYCILADTNQNYGTWSNPVKCANNYQCSSDKKTCVIISPTPTPTPTPNPEAIYSQCQSNQKECNSNNPSQYRTCVYDSQAGIEGIWSGWKNCPTDNVCSSGDCRPKTCKSNSECETSYCDLSNNRCIPKPQIKVDLPDQYCISSSDSCESGYTKENSCSQCPSDLYSNCCIKKSSKGISGLLSLVKSKKADGEPCTTHNECNSLYCQGHCFSQEEIMEFTPSFIDQNNIIFTLYKFRNIFPYIPEESEIPDEFRLIGCGPTSLYNQIQFIKNNYALPVENQSLLEFMKVFNPQFNNNLAYVYNGYRRRVDMSDKTNIEEIRTVNLAEVNTINQQLDTDRLRVTRTYGITQPTNGNVYYSQAVLESNIKILNDFANSGMDASAIIQGSFCQTNGNCADHLSLIQDIKNIESKIIDGKSVLVVTIQDSYFIDENNNQTWLLITDPKGCKKSSYFNNSEYQGHICMDEFFLTIINPPTGKSPI